MTTTEQINQETSDKGYEIWLAGIGALAFAREKGGDFYHQFVKKGQELAASSGLLIPS